MHQKRIKVEVPITDWDIEDFKSLLEDKESFTWAFPTEDEGYMVTIKFVADEED